MACYRYIELNPIRANMVTRLADYRWSSYQFNGQGEQSDWLEPHSIYLSLGLNGAERQCHYRALFKIELEDDLIGKIRRTTQFSMPRGNDRFKSQIETALGRKIGHMKKGRPKLEFKNQVQH